MSIDHAALILTAKSRLEPKSKGLQAPKRLRAVTPRVCATCAFHRMTPGAIDCIRPDGPSFDAGDMDAWFATCDRWMDERVHTDQA